MHNPSTTRLNRRELLRFGTLAAAGSLMTRFQPAMAGPFENAVATPPCRPR